MAQVVGGILGAVLANVMFDLPAGQIATTDRVSVGHGVGEVVATAGLVLLIFALARTGRAALSAAAVGAYIGAAYWFTSSTSFANPAVTVGRMFSDTFAGIAPGSVPLFVAAQIVGAGRGPRAGPAAVPRRLGRRRPGRRPPHQRRHHHREGLMHMSKPSVLFVCVHNAGRSQMAAGVPHPPVPGRGRGPLGRLGARRSRSTPPRCRRWPRSASTSPPSKPKILTDQAVRESDVVITMGCGDTCPFYPGKRYEDWVLDDPAGKGVESVRPIRDEIRRRVDNLLDQLVPA